MAQTRRTRRTRRTKRTKRIRGGVDDNASDIIREQLHVLFPEFNPSRFIIKETDDNYQINLTKCEEQPRHSQKYSPRISISKDGRMYIERLTSCAPVSGAEIIHRYIRLARKLELHSISLDDESEIYFPRSRYGEERCAVNLSILRILQKGESWYESLGFVSFTSDANHAQNEQVRHMPFGAFVEKLVEKELEGKMDRIRRKCQLNNNTSQQNRDIANAKKKKSEVDGVMDIFPEIHVNTPVKEAIQMMVDRVNQTENACESVPFRILQKVIEICTATKEPLIHYHSRKLTMTL